MKRLLLLVVLAGAGYLGYRYYTGSSQALIPPDIMHRFVVKQTSAGSSDFLQILGAATSNLIDKSTDLLNNATDGQAEPVINKAVSDLQDRVKELPKEEYQKVKAEFCKDVLVSPAPSPETSQ